MAKSSELVDSSALRVQISTTSTSFPQQVLDKGPTSDSSESITSLVKTTLMIGQHQPEGAIDVVVKREEETTGIIGSELMPPTGFTFRRRSASSRTSSSPIRDASSSQIDVSWEQSSPPTLVMADSYTFSSDFVAASVEVKTKSVDAPQSLHLKPGNAARVPDAPPDIERKLRKRHDQCAGRTVGGLNCNTRIGKDKRKDAEKLLSLLRLAFDKCEQDVIADGIRTYLSFRFCSRHWELQHVDAIPVTAVFIATFERGIEVRSGVNDIKPCLDPHLDLLKTMKIIDSELRSSIARSKAGTQMTVQPTASNLSNHIRKALGKRDLADGYVYLYTHGVADFDHCKIGYTTNTPAIRLEEQRNKCKKDYTFFDWREPIRISHAYRVERLVHIELKPRRRVNSQPCACGRTHREWFKASARYGFAVINKWVRWMEEEPYMLSDGFWVLKPEFEAKIEEICTPIDEKLVYERDMTPQPEHRSRPSASFHSEGGEIKIEMPKLKILDWSSAALKEEGSPVSRGRTKGSNVATLGVPSVSLRSQSAKKPTGQTLPFPLLGDTSLRVATRAKSEGPDPTVKSGPRYHFRSSKMPG